MILEQWTAHPAKTRPRDLALVGCVLFLTMGAVLVAFQSLFLMALAVVLLIAAVAPFLFPTHYVLTDEGVIERRLFRKRSRSWSDFRRLQVGEGAALVSPFSTPRWLDRYRGILLMFDGGDRDAIVEILEDRVPARG